MPKKKTALTIEERLQQALVPAEEQPYEVPENWVWVRLGAVCGFERGITFPSSAKQNERDDENIPCLRTANVQDELELNDLIYVNKKYYKNNIDKLIRENDIIMSTANSRELVGKTSFVYKVEYPMIFGGFVMALRANKLLSKFLFYYLRLEFLLGRFRGESTQTTNIANISSSVLGEYTFPLPPLSEQQRIVERIEELFAKLDEAKERLQEVADSFAVHKAAILHKSFTGELTKQWRRKNGVSDESWEERKLGEVGSWLGGGTPSTSREEYWENGNILWITSKDMKSTVIEDTLMKVNEIGVKNSSANYIEKPALLVVMRSGILRRTFPVAMVKKPFTVNQDLKAIIPDEDDLEFLYWMLLSNEQRILNTCMKNGTTVESINSNALKDLTFKCPTLPEQHEIVRLIDDLLARERAAQQATEQALASIDLMKKSILARAFRGELGTNKASEASALELLKQVLAEG